MTRIDRDETRVESREARHEKREQRRRDRTEGRDRSSSSSSSSSDNEGRLGGMMHKKKAATTPHPTPTHQPPPMAVHQDKNLESDRPDLVLDTMEVDVRLTEGQVRKSKGKNVVLNMQGDGNLVLYGPNSKVLWAAGTNKNVKGNFAILQRDGNFVVYNHQSSPLWASNTAGKGSPPHRLLLQDDGNLVIYDAANHVIKINN
ncbi:hypothetical protein HDU92_005254 [Lobulomyces angularis]|nr:hypothetical protein HDU92_005254 [Lobulomyces angularis]